MQPRHIRYNQGEIDGLITIAQLRVSEYTRSQK